MEIVRVYLIWNFATLPFLINRNLLLGYDLYYNMEIGAVNKLHTDDDTAVSDWRIIQVYNIRKKSYCFCMICNITIEQTDGISTLLPFVSFR